MREIVIISGKGGTGKTSLTAAFSSLAENSIFCDADVDAADLHLLLGPENISTNDFYAGGIAAVRQDDCISCGTCLELCRFGAITDDFTVDTMRCEGCGVCVDNCPEQAIDFPARWCGKWYVSATRYGRMVHAKLGIAQENSGRLVSMIRKEAGKIAEEEGLELILTDGPPGIGCPVIAAITGASLLVIVVEPTVSGLHDLERVAGLARHFRIPAMVCINKYDINGEMSENIERHAVEHGMKLAGKIPFDRKFTESMVAAKSFLELEQDSKTAQAIKEVWHRVDEASRQPELSAAQLVII
ncbi:MAG: (4Fe-4S)-binding protein [Deltaproteobacteria bacterium]|nr:MAG: (4Fe-4S)-binding protein [Deltaproteobacteria bacterium]